MQKRISNIGYPILLLFSLNQAALGASCEDELPQVASSAIDPLKDASQSMKRKGVQITVNGVAQSSIQKPEFFDFSTDLFTVLNDQKNPLYSEYSQDAAAADAVFNFILGGQASQPISIPIDPKPVHPLIGRVGPSPILPLPPVTTETPPTNIDELKLYLGKQHLSDRATLYLISKFTAKADKLYGNASGKAPSSKKDSMERTFQALLTGKKQAGECGPIHQFGAFVADSLGMKDTCLMGTDWKSKASSTTAHDVACFRDPKSKKFYWLNYDDLTQSRSEFLSEAAQEEAVNMSILSASVSPETRALWEKSHPHQMQGDRARELVNDLHRVGEVDASGVAINAGNLSNTVTVQKRVVGGADRKAGVFAIGSETRSELPLQVGVAGVYGHSEGSTPLTHSLSLDHKVDAEAGMIVSHDQSPKGNAFSGPSRTDTGFLVTGRGEADLAWAKDHKPGSAGVDGKFDEFGYLSKYGTNVGQPYNALGFKGSQQLTKTIEVHGRVDTYYYLDGMWKQLPAAPSLTLAYENVGVTAHHDLDHGRFSLNNSIDDYHFRKGAGGIREEFEAEYKKSHSLNFLIKGEVAATYNHSGDIFYDYAPTCKGEVKAVKVFSHGVLQLGLRKTCNDHRIFTYMQDGALPTGSNLTEARTSGFVTWTR